ncbi:hypothetical protein Gogos_006509, partial [Gossypium gossypioides]|nr:hypothetical protein [Gossypium gossypioides]
QDIKWNTSEVIKISYNWAKQYISYHKEGLAKWQQVKKAFPWTNNWVQLNSDGAVKVDYGKAASKGVLRDQEGLVQVILEFCIDQVNTSDVVE